MKKIKIVFVIKDFRGGVQTFLEQISKLDKRKFELSFVFLSKDNFSTYPSENTYFLSKNISISSVIGSINVINKLSRLVEKVSPSIIVTFPIYPFLITNFVNLFFKKKFKNITIINNNVPALFEEKKIFSRILFGRLYKYFLNKAEKIVFISEGLKDNFQADKNITDRNHRITSLIHHSVEADIIKKKSIEPIEKKLARTFTDKGTVKLVTIGRLDKQKDLYTVLNAFKKICDNYTKAILIVIGDGLLKKDLKILSKELGITDKVYFTGWRKNPYKYLKNSDIYLFSSNYEGFGMTIVEAMALGVPVVATDTPYGPREILGGGKYGILVPMRDPKKMAQSIITLIRSKKLRDKYKKLGVSRVKKYDTRLMLRKYENLFLNI